MKSKLIIFFVLLLIGVNQGFSQLSVSATDCGLTYLYDNAGNRVARVWLNCQTTGKQDASEVAEVSQEANGESEEELVTKLEITLFPNPTSDVVNLTFSAEVTNVRVVVTDNTGKVIKDDRHSGLSVPLNLQSLSSGLYYVSVFDDKKKLSGSSVMKQ